VGLSDRLSHRWGAQPADPAAPQEPVDHHADNPAGRHAAGSGERYRASARAIGDPVAEVRKRIHRSLLEILGPKLYEDIGGDDDLARRVRDTIATLLAREDTPLAGADKARIAREVTDEILGHGPIEPLLRDPAVSEIMVNGPRRIYVERSGRLHVVDAEFADEAHLRRVIDRIVSRVGRRVDEASPMVDARLPDGSRVNAVVPPVALDGSTLTIRKFSADPLQVDDLICSPRAYAAGWTSSSAAVPARARRRRSTCCPGSSRPTSGWSRSRTPRSSNCTRTTWYAWSPARPTPRAGVR
jgi:pilus assembly protein CpaF